MPYKFINKEYQNPKSRWESMGINGIMVPGLFRGSKAAISYFLPFIISLFIFCYITNKYIIMDTNIRNLLCLVLAFAVAFFVGTIISSLSGQY
jgi:hypothetical protein